jgi:ATP-binding cassette subfamily C (CFTR/MRP) protein 1
LQQLALADLNLSIAPGEKVAICGRSGRYLYPFPFPHKNKGLGLTLRFLSGKSSTILPLLRLLDPLPYCSDKIFIDDTPLHKIDRAVLRQRLIAVPQDPVFLPDGSSFQTNIDPFGASTEEECRAVLETVRLWPFISEQGGLSAKMSADELSQGQRQLFSLARAVLRRRIRSRELAGEVGEEGAVQAAGGILLLDEVSSSVDQHTDREMQEVILREFESYTIIMVSHRLRMVMEFDTVVVMDQGRIVETGKPRVLADKQGSRFRDLWMVGNKG